MIHAFKNRTCGECVFHDAPSDQPEVNGACRRFPPRPLIIPQAQQRVTPTGPQMQAGFVVNSFFPITMNKISACGEFAPAEGQAVQ